ncbi:MAG: DUF5009 domain-containing protein [Acidobacteria bacterium]|nr:DUF5009 domain-containing protein [Acidobacteriota bacterium]
MPEATPQQRLISIDVFRGMTIAGMTLVNNPGTWEHIYSPLEHAPWHGITPTDYIFPFFLFIVGVAIPIALSKRIEAGITRDAYFKIFTRAALIFVLSLIMSAIPFFGFKDTQIPYAVKILIVLGYTAALFLYLCDKKKVALIVAAATALVVLGFWLAGSAIVPYNLGTMRILGVLQRIAICYLIVSILYLHTSWKQQAMIGGSLLLFYWFLMTAISVPGCEITTIDDKACNLAAYLDRLILTEPHIWRGGKVYDPEGLLSTIPAIVTTISGVLTGTWLMTKREPLEKVSGIFFFGVVLLAAGWSWSLVFPLNKSLWTSSYVLYTSGLALCFLGFCYWLIDIKSYKRWAKPFVIFGVNALALFVFSGIMARLLGMIQFAGAEEGQNISLQELIFDNIFLSILSPINASLAFAIGFILFWLFLMWLLYRRRIFIKV